MTPKTNIIGNSIGSPFAGIKSNSRRVMGIGSEINATIPTIIAACFLPKRFDMIGVKIIARKAESRIDSESKAI